VGLIETFGDAAGLYTRTVLSRLRPRIEGMRVLLDCANGAAYEAAPLAFGELGAELTVVGDEPDGTNINEGVGSTHVERLDASGHDVAFAFDGDADRVLAVDEEGRVVHGDVIVAILARDLKEHNALKGPVVVTVMSNLGFFKAMESLGIPCEVTPVGDRHVAAKMQEKGASLGGEQSGHVILSEHATTGDGLVTALALLDVVVRSGEPLSKLARVAEVYPQTLINVHVEGKMVVESAAVKEAVARAEEKLGERGRILLRPSGTEPVVRVMTEHEDEDICREVCEEVAGVVAFAKSGREPEVRS
jgi:phosphoglucosamine mutase